MDTKEDWRGVRRRREAQKRTSVATARTEG